jgi:hypothetical protein
LLEDETDIEAIDKKYETIVETILEKKKGEDEEEEEEEGEKKKVKESKIPSIMEQWVNTMKKETA